MKVHHLISLRSTHTVIYRDIIPIYRRRERQGADDNSCRTRYRPEPLHIPEQAQRINNNVSLASHNCYLYWTMIMYNDLFCWANGLRDNCTFLFITRTIFLNVLSPLLIFHVDTTPTNSYNKREPHQINVPVDKRHRQIISYWCSLVPTLFDEYAIVYDTPVIKVEHACRSD